MNDLDQALKNSFPRTTGPCTSVHVLLLRWIDDDLQVQREINDLRCVFRERFHFEVEQWDIPNTNSTRELQDKLYAFQKAHQSELELLIVYYGGHGKFSADGRSIWTALVVH